MGALRPGSFSGNHRWSLLHSTALHDKTGGGLVVSIVQYGTCRLCVHGWFHLVEQCSHSDLPEVDLGSLIFPAFNPSVYHFHFASFEKLINLHTAVFFSLQSLCVMHTGKPTGVAV